MNKLEDWEPTDWIVIVIAGAIAICLIVSLFTEEPNDPSSVERIVLSLSAIITLYIGAKLKNNK